MRIPQPSPARLLRALLPLLALPLLLSACGDDDDGIQWAPGGGDDAPEVSQSEARVADRMECPRLKGDASERLLSYWTREGGDSVMTYCLAYDLEKLHARWVAFRFDAQTRKTGSNRNDAWQDDTRLPQKYRIGTGTFGSGYDRGHICASYDRQYSVAANQNTFYMTNMSPMIGDFNGGYWSTLEQLVQNLGRDKAFASTLYVVKGGTLSELMGYVSRTGGKRVAVPRYYFTALLSRHNGVYHSIAFLMEHKDYGYSYESPAPRSVLKQHVLTVNALEKRTGIDLFPNLPDDREESIEDECEPSVWRIY